MRAIRNDSYIGAKADAMLPAVKIARTNIMHLLRSKRDVKSGVTRAEIITTIANKLTVRLASVISRLNLSAIAGSIPTALISVLRTPNVPTIKTGIKNFELMIIPKLELESTLI